LTLAAIILGEKLGAKLVVLHGFDPGRIGVFAGPHNSRAAAIQFTREMERLGYCTVWCGESFARGACVPGATYLAVDGMH
jgi:alkanesulfonate monooxygenase SsuD/methylene tetrahydromethanopterin reductase-like flavin-dependent oxidoreductase (luciferase family)